MPPIPEEDLPSALINRFVFRTVEGGLPALLRFLVTLTDDSQQPAEDARNRGRSIWSYYPTIP